MDFNWLGQRTFDLEPSGEPPVPPLKTYYTLDCPPRSELVGRKALIVGYGLQGRPTALNLRDSGVEVTIGVRFGGHSEKNALRDGFPVLDSGRGVPESSEAVFLLAPDPLQEALLRAAILPTMHAGQLLVFAHGYALVYANLPMPLGVDVVVLAPHGPGTALRERYVGGSGLPAQLALHRDPSGTALDRALLWGSGLGYDCGGMRPCSVCAEVHLDLFVEQALLCGGLVELTLAIFETAVRAGYDPEQVLHSTVGEVGNTALLLQEHGPVGLYKRISEIALKGSLLNGPAVVDATVHERAARVLAQIESGAFEAGLDGMRDQLRERMQALRAHEITRLLESLEQAHMNSR